MFLTKNSYMKCKLTQSVGQTKCLQQYFPIIRSIYIVCLQNRGAVVAFFLFPWAPSVARITPHFEFWEWGPRIALSGSDRPSPQNVWSSPSHDGCAALFSPTPPFLRALAEAPGQDFAPKVRREMGCDPRAAAKEQPGAWAERAERVSSYHDQHRIAAETLKPLRVQVSTPPEDCKLLL